MACVSRAPPRQFEQCADVKDKDQGANPPELLSSSFSKTKELQNRGRGGYTTFLLRHSMQETELGVL